MSDKTKQEKLEIVEDKKKHFWLYILKLEKNKYYVGITSMADPNKRIAQHQAGYFSAQWTKKYKPVETLEIRNLGYLSLGEAKRLEDIQTLQHIKLYGLQNVRGGTLNYSGRYVKIGSRYGRGSDVLSAVVIIYLVIFLAYFLIIK